MRKIIIISGIIAGLITSSWAVIYFALGIENMNFDNGMWYGYASMLLAFSVIFVGVKNFRDKYQNGLISFGKAFQIGLFITLIASSIYVIVWLIDYYYFIPNFEETYTACMLKKMKADGAGQTEINAQMVEMAKFNKMYKNNTPFIILVTYAEIIPVGLVISLISALLLKRKTQIT